VIRVATGSRLHFGLFHVPKSDVQYWSDWHGDRTLPAGQFGGVGLMIEAPAVELKVARAVSWQASGPMADRALAFARRFAETTPEVQSAYRIAVAHCPPEHVGFGTGTQLGLAVARAIAHASGLTNASATALAARIGRGQRSGIGTHGFARGGLLFQAGQRAVAAKDFPSDWRIVVILPSGTPGLHGSAEIHAFERLATPSPAWTDALCRLVLFGMLPALVEQNFDAFGEAIHDFNARVGEAFAPVQGGTYANARVAEVVRFVREQGVRGVGQSSWGPAVFAIVPNQERAEDLARRLRSQSYLPKADVIVTSARNSSAEVSSVA
jgi:predicted sugar kinase